MSFDLTHTPLFFFSLWTLSLTLLAVFLALLRVPRPLLLFVLRLRWEQVVFEMIFAPTCSLLARRDTVLIAFILGGGGSVVRGWAVRGRGNVEL